MFVIIGLSVTSNTHIDKKSDVLRVDYVFVFPGNVKIYRNMLYKSCKVWLIVLYNYSITVSSVAFSLQ